MRLASHILAVFVAISTLVSPCLASIKTGQDSDSRIQNAAFVTLLPDQDENSTRIDEKASDACNGPCARLLTARNIQPQRSNHSVELSGIEPATLIVQEKSAFPLPATKKFASLTPWNRVDIYSLCRQLI